MTERRRKMEAVCDEITRLRAIEAAARAVVACEARYSTESYCDDEWHALRGLLDIVAPGRAAASGEGE